MYEQQTIIDSDLVTCKHMSPNRGEHMGGECRKLGEILHVDCTLKYRITKERGLLLRDC